MMWISAYNFKVRVHQILAALCPFEIFGNFLVPNLLHFQFTSGALNCTGDSICATSYYLPSAYDASACGALPSQHST